MDIARTVFETLDKAFDKKFNGLIDFENADKVKTILNVQYSDSDKTFCKLDIHHIPQKHKKYPVLVNIHGGGFVAGSKEHRNGISTWFATQGFFVVNVNYGLCPECKFPTPLVHLVEALNWIYDNAKKFNLNLFKVAICGDSAGAYYASMLTTLCKSKKLQTVFQVSPKIKINACILNCGIYDLNQALKEKLLFDLNLKIFESYSGVNKSNLDTFKLKDYCSPLPFMTKKFPPTFLIYAKKDMVCKGQAELIIEKFNRLDIYFESYNSKSIFRNHCFSLDWSTKEAKEANALVKQFLEKFKKGKLPKHQSHSSEIIREEEK